MLTYRRSDILEIVGYSDADYAGDRDDRKSTQDMYSLSQGELSHGEVPSKN
jgi:hypothetical protein